MATKNLRVYTLSDSNGVWARQLQVQRLRNINDAIRNSFFDKYKSRPLLSLRRALALMRITNLADGGNIIDC